MYPGVELRLCRYAAMLAEELNFTRIARRLHVAKPNLTRQIRPVGTYPNTAEGLQGLVEEILQAAKAKEIPPTIFFKQNAVNG